VNEPLLTILMPTFQNPGQLQTTIDSLVVNTEYPYKIKVLNNDPSTEALENAVRGADFDGLEVEHMGGNLGWMGAINKGMETVDTKFVALCNDDLIWPPGQGHFWRIMGQWFDEFSDLGAVGPGSNFVMGLQNIQNVKVPPSFFTPLLIGFCIMMRSEHFREVGLLDETLPGGDDLDLSIRLKKAGFRLFAERRAYVHHVGAQTGGRVHGNYWNSLEQTDRSNNALIRKHSVSDWYHLFDTPDFASQVQGQAEGGQSWEDQWLEETIPKEGAGVNLGCGARPNGKWGLDVQRTGEKGAGGRKFEGAAPDITGDASNIPVQDGSLDYIVACHLFEHLVDPTGALKEFRRALKPGGDLILSLPNHDRQETMMIDYTHVHAYNPGSARNLLETAGWKIKEERDFETIGSFGMVAS